MPDLEIRMRMGTEHVLVVVSIDDGQILLDDIDILGGLSEYV